jgi:hypothetical protein
MQRFQIWIWQAFLTGAGLAQVADGRGPWVDVDASVALSWQTLRGCT